MKPRILLAGLGETGFELVQRIYLDWSIVGVDLDEGTNTKLQQLDMDDGFIFQLGDATSALVLKRTGVKEVHAAVACTGSDEVNLEFLRIARDLFEINTLFALMYSLDWEERYVEEGVERISQDHACAAILEARVQRGQKVATGVGLGEGEIIEVEVLPNSSVIGRPLMELGPKRWLVGAIYRNKKLVVPHGDTVLESGDRVLLIGDPEILSSIATFVRTGESEFPLQYGSHVVTVHSERMNEVLDEAAYLVESTRAELLEAIACDVDKEKVQAMLAACRDKDIPCELSCGAGDTTASLMEGAGKRDVGVLILPPERMSFLSRIGLKGTRTARIFNLVTSPVLISRKTFPYRRVLIALAELPFHTAAAQLAIDLVRMVDAELHLGVVHQPEIVAGAALKKEVEQRMHDIEVLAGMYHVKIKTTVMEGNPIHEIMRESEKFDLIVLPYKRGRGAFLTRPDVGLNVIHRAHCSVLVMPY
ncbi:MAG: universal stress protein [Deltaproteobacteria bacterium]|nr:universal stress protein [Deltaproteobacteria bacterium]